MRYTQDSIGQLTIPKSAYWDTSTQRARNDFPLQDYNKIPKSLLKSLCIIKLAAIKTHKKYQKIDEKICQAIIEAAQIIINKIDLKNDIYTNYFPLSIWQSGSGTQTNMNVNEVIANVACEILGYEKGRKDIVHPNDHVNLGQSTNDCMPTAMRITTLIEINTYLIPTLEKLKNILFKKSEEWTNIVKIGRTHLQDAVPMTLGQEFNGYYNQTKQILDNLKTNLYALHQIPQGGTAVGTGINNYLNFDISIVDELAQLTNLPLVTSDSKFAHISSHDALVLISGIISTFASFMYKMAQDISLLASGPKCGIGELILPVDHLGSSIMPGKINPIGAEIIKMISINAMSNHNAILQSNCLGNLQLNTVMPLIIYKLLDSIYTLSESVSYFAESCIDRLQPNVQRINDMLANSSIVITALTKKIGYDKATEIALKAYKNNINIHDQLIAENLITEEEWQEITQWIKLTNNKY